MLVNLAPNFGKRQLVKIVGSSNNPEKVVEQALLSAIPSLDGEFNNLFELLETLCNTGKDEHDGFILFIDEMGKLLEAAAHGKGDVFFFQQLAEFAARSKGRLLIVGVLHLAFNEYWGAYHRKPSANGSKLQAVSMTSASTFLERSNSN